MCVFRNVTWCKKCGIFFNIKKYSIIKISIVIWLHADIFKSEQRGEKKPKRHLVVSSIKCENSVVNASSSSFAFSSFFSSSLFFLLWFFNVLNSLCHKIVDCSLLIIREMEKKAHGEWKNRAHYCCAGLFWSLQPFSRSVQVARSYQNISLFHVLIHSGHSWHCTPAHHITRSHSHRNSLNA